MFKEIKGGTLYKILDAFDVPFDCWVPPLGYGLNAITGELEKTDIIKRSNSPSEQYWERETLPNWYDKKREIEERLQESDPEHIDPECEKWREKFWRRRLSGMWFYNQGKPLYVTGRHWFLLNTWKFQGKWFDFRIPNMEFCYVVDYCFEDPNCLGIGEITKRKDGKTARAGCFEYEYISRTEAKHGAIQSKPGDDADEFFQKAIISPWQKLPHFFKPRYDTSGGTNPKKELRFFNASIKGARKITQDKALESWIDFRSAREDAYDGPELPWYVSDECGKLINVSILKRHSTVRFCSEIDGEFRGFFHYSTTVEEMDSGGSEFQTLVKMSDRRQLDGNGRTKSGLYFYFQPAYKTLYFDKYGYPDEARAKTYYMNTRASLESQPAELSSFIRKNPFTLSESFRVDGEKCLYDPEKLNNQLDSIIWKENLVTRGNFHWMDGEPFTKVEFKPDRQGRFSVTWLFDKFEEANKVIKQNGLFVPTNTHLFCGGVDPFKFDVVLDNRRSDCGGYIFKKFDVHNHSEQHNEAFVCQYKFRASTTSAQYEDVLKMAWYFGCQLLIENNIGTAPKDYFAFKKCQHFLMKLPQETDPGIYTDGQGKVKQQLADYTQSYIDQNIHKVFFKDLIEEWLEFDITKTTKYDLAMAAGFALIAAKRKVYSRDPEKTTDIKNYFRSYSTA